jgi:hypothetical protein
MRIQPQITDSLFFLGKCDATPAATPAAIDDLRPTQRQNPASDLSTVLAVSLRGWQSCRYRRAFRQHLFQLFPASSRCLDCVAQLNGGLQASAAQRRRTCPRRGGSDPGPWHTNNPYFCGIALSDSAEAETN